MTPQERELVTQLFGRLAGLEDTPRDPEAERAVIEGLRRAPNAAYALVQTVLVQDEALKRADARIRDLEGAGNDEQPAQPAGFLDSMREALLGRRETPRTGSVPSIRPSQTATGTPAGMGGAPWQQSPVSSGGSFLGTAAAAAAGMIGGSLLLDGIRSMSGHGQSAFGNADPAFGATRDVNSPWDNAAGGDLARQAGIDDIGSAAPGGGHAGSGWGLFDNSPDDSGADQQADQDFGGFDDSGDNSDFGGSDAA
jgi:uncharacterized protein